MYVIISTKIPAIIHTIAICFNVRRFRTWDGVKVQICSGRRQSDVSSSLQVRYLRKRMNVYSFIHSFYLYFVLWKYFILHFTFFQLIVQCVASAQFYLFCTMCFCSRASTFLCVHYGKGLSLLLMDLDTGLILKCVRMDFLISEF